VVQFKICGLMRPEDARAAEEAGAAYAGVILAPGSRRSLDLATAESVLGGTTIRRCGVFVDAAPHELTAAADRLRLDVLQLHGDESPELVESIRGGCSGLEVWKAVRLRSGADFLNAVERYASVADALLLDGWSAAARGGTGAKFPWAEVAAHRQSLSGSVRMIAAGGLDPDNVAGAITLLRPDVVDVSSGVEASPGAKDPFLIRRFAAAVRAAGADNGAG
jgi:phosphoribosylanthranilate isomerase